MSRALDLIKLAQDLEFAQNILNDFAAGNQPWFTKHEMARRFMDYNTPDTASGNSPLPNIASTLSKAPSRLDEIGRILMGAPESESAYLAREDYRQKLGIDEEDLLAQYYANAYRNTNSIGDVLTGVGARQIGDGPRGPASLSTALMRLRDPQKAPEALARAYMNELLRPTMRRPEAEDIALAINTILARDPSVEEQERAQQIDEQERAQEEAQGESWIRRITRDWGNA